MGADDGRVRISEKKPELSEIIPATETPEKRGLRRDEVRLLVIGDSVLEHMTFTDLPAHLRAGDVLVVNNSGTLAAAVPGYRASGEPVVAHFSSRMKENYWSIELRMLGSRAVRNAMDFRDNRKIFGVRAGERIALAASGQLTIEDSYPRPGATSSRLWTAHLEAPLADYQYLNTVGQPIRYKYLKTCPPLSSYQTVFALHPGSAEMPSAGRPFSAEIVTQLVSHGVLVVPVTLHTGVSSAESDEPPYPERYVVPLATASTINEARRSGGRVIAVGTTTVRALETAAKPDGMIRGCDGWTHLVIDSEHRPRAVDGVLTGFHPPGASHLDLLKAVVGANIVSDSYSAISHHMYLSHEFGDVCLMFR